MIFAMKSSISTDSAKIERFLMHAVENIYPSREALRTKLLKGERISVYLGIDPTGSVLHLGHIIPLQKLAELQELGHHIILLIGDFTAMIGDPTDKTATRKQLTHDQVLENCKQYQKQAGKILRFDGPNPAELKFNSEWLGKLKFEQVIELASHFTVQQMLERDMFEKRVEEKKPIHLHEFFYPLMQGYDAAAMDVDLEIGGNDQTFNMLAGRDLMKVGVFGHKPKDKFVLATRLLTDQSGKKMGKTEGNMITLTDTPEDMYGKVMSWTDEMIIPGFEILTDVTTEELKTIKTKLGQGENPMTWKGDLAHRLVSWLHSREAANDAANQFQKVHQKHEQPDEIPVVRVQTKKLALIDALVIGKLVESKSEARRQIEQGSVKVDGQVVEDVKAMVSVKAKGMVIQKGKRHFIKLIA